MDLFDAMKGRRSIRNYREASVEKETVNQLLHAATLAPSAMNSQPWAFTIIQNTALLKNLSDQAKSYLIDHCMTQDSPLNKYHSILSKSDFNIFYNASTLITIYAKPISPHALEDCCLAAQNLMLSAHALGLGSCWIGFASPFLNKVETKKEFGVPESYKAVAPIILGYPHNTIALKDKKPPEIINWQ